jgi:hypothetical protein
MPDHIRVMFTGSRHFCDRGAVAKVLQSIDRDAHILVGDCPTGLDVFVRELTHRRPRTIFTANWDTHGIAAGPIRNQEMVDTGPTVCFAFLRQDEDNRGTRDAMRRARRAGVVVCQIGSEDT